MDLAPLPDGWRREFDPNTEHTFYVDTKANPPRSIWVHPWEDPVWLSTVPDSERPEHLRQQPAPARDEKGHHADTRQHTSAYANTDNHGSSSSHAAGGGSQAARPEEKRTLGRKLKDKVSRESRVSLSEWVL